MGGRSPAITPQHHVLSPSAPYRQSDQAAGVQLRIGLDPKGGTDPASGNIKWSAPVAPYDQWAEMNVTAKSDGDGVTMFLYMTQAAGLAMNNMYWDKASLVRTENAPPDATATPFQVPFVKPQGVRPDGSIVHVVQAGDTLSSIAYAYRDYNVNNEIDCRAESADETQYTGFAARPGNHHPAARIG